MSAARVGVHAAGFQRATHPHRAGDRRRTVDLRLHLGREGIERRVGAELADAVPDELTSITARLGDPTTSVRYGAEYVKILSADPTIKGNLVRLLAGYNAGPAAVANWQSAANDPLLYIESIPYAETRNYVMQVLAQYWVYQSLDGQTPATLAAIRQGNWPQEPHSARRHYRLREGCYEHRHSPRQNASQCWG